LKNGKKFDLLNKNTFYLLFRSTEIRSIDPHSLYRWYKIKPFKEEVFLKIDFSAAICFQNDLSSIKSVDLRLKHLDDSLRAKGFDFSVHVRKWRRVEVESNNCEIRLKINYKAFSQIFLNEEYSRSDTALTR
jgi:hypothetical protein